MCSVMGPRKELLSTKALTQNVEHSTNQHTHPRACTIQRFRIFRLGIQRKRIYVTNQHSCSDSCLFDDESTTYMKTLGSTFVRQYWHLEFDINRMIWTLKWMNSMCQPKWLLHIQLRILNLHIFIFGDFSIFSFGRFWLRVHRRSFSKFPALDAELELEEH